MSAKAQRVKEAKERLREARRELLVARFMADDAAYELSSAMEKPRMSLRRLALLAQVASVDASAYHHAAMVVGRWEALLAAAKAGRREVRSKRIVPGWPDLLATAYKGSRLRRKKAEALAAYQYAQDREDRRFRRTRRAA